ncbi:rhamnosyl transferase [Aureococcus anophagefferens]|nr:rhamnosyl transferase [Aureococcus anophagefferens]
MLWLHVHNAGGTSIRTLAATYGERPLEPATKNWNLWLHAKETWRTISCREKVDLFKRQAAATWTMIERPFDAADAACAELAYGTTLRSPVSTMLSTIVTNNVDVDALFEALERRGSPLNASIPHDQLIEEGALLGHFDNYFVRSLNGRDVSQAAGLGMLTEAHLDTALERLRRFDVVLVLEDGAALDDAPLRRFRGWPAAEGETVWYNAHSAASKARALAGGLEGAGVALRSGGSASSASAKLDERLLVAARDMAPPATGGVKLLNVGHGTSGTRSLFKSLCAAGYVALHFNQICNVNETLPAPRAARLLDAHARATALFAEASWTRDHFDDVLTRRVDKWFAHEKRKLRAQGQHVPKGRAKVAALKARYEATGFFARVRALCRGAGGPHCAIESWLSGAAGRRRRGQGAGMRAYEASTKRRRADALRAVGRDRYLEMSWWDAGGHFDRVVKALRPARTLRQPLAAALDADGRVAWHFAAASFAHVVVTRFDDGEATQPELLEARLLAFKAAAVEKDAPATVCAAGALEWRPVHWDTTRQYTEATLKAADAIRAASSPSTNRQINAP